MSGKILVQIKAPVTQSIEVAKALLKFYNHDQEVAELLRFFCLCNAMVIGV